jgi:dihydrofolate reductase
MIRAIAAIDNNRGVATDKGIPWKLPADVRHEHRLIKGGNLLMGFNTYKECDQPPEGDKCFVLTDNYEPMRPGFEPVNDLEGFLKNPPQNLWLFGGAGLFAKTIKFADELYLTRVSGDFRCTKFFPPFADEFELAEKSEPMEENGTKFRFEVWKRKA